MSAPDTWRVNSEDAPHASTDPQVDTPSLNIFLGSTPSYAALEAMRRLVYLPESDRRKVALVFLDIDSPPAEVLQFRQEHLGQLREFDLRISVAHGVLYADQLDPTVANHTYIPTKIPESFDNGAGGIRNNGHVAASADHDKIVQTLDEALAQIGALPTDRGARPVTEVAVNIVAFLGGGTGSGIVADLAVMTRHRILQLNLKHRLNIFCLLPEHLKEATTNDVSWRKSNATATIMELVALSLVRGRQDGGAGPYVHYMLHTPYEVRGTTIANEIFLFGRTSMTSAQDAARIVGLDLYMRITNASGVGFLERSKAVDRRTLGNYDSNGLPTMFGTSCPLEVSFPAVETATAFAQLTAAKVLPLLAHDLGEGGGGQLNASELDAVKDWDSAIKPEDPPPFTEKSFMTAGRDRLDQLEARLNKHVGEASEEIGELVTEREAAEKSAIYGAGLEPLGAQIARLQRRKRVYNAALAKVQDQSAPSKSRPDRMLQRTMLRPWPLPGAKERAVNAVVDDFNRVQRKNIRGDYLKAKKALLLRLIEYVDAELKTVKRFQGDIDLEQTSRDLERVATASAAWRGQLDHGHVHVRHIFDLPGVTGMNTGDGLASPPVQRLYEQMTTRDMEGYVQRYIEWTERTHGSDATLVTGAGVEMRDRLVSYLRDEVYLKPLLGMNLFDLLERCCVLQGERPDRKVEDILLGHLQHISGLARDMVAFEAQLWNEGGGMLSSSLYLGMSWRTGAQKHVLDRARSRITAIAKEGASPMLESAIDPHRMQLAYGQHAISIGTIPDFYQENNSGMGEFMRHQVAWCDPSGERPYGQSRAPVFSSGEMERLVMDPTALGDRAALGRPMRTLPERIMRRPQQGAGQAPRWVAQPTIQPNAQPPYQLAPDATAQNGHGSARTRTDSVGGYPGDAYYGPRSS